MLMRLEPGALWFESNTLPLCHCTPLSSELKVESVECAMFLDQTSFGHLGHINDPLMVTKFHYGIHERLAHILWTPIGSILMITAIFFLEIRKINYSWKLPHIDGYM